MSKIIRLQADNFKKLTVIDVRPGAGMVPIRGRNAQGKSSTLDAIQAALGGKSVMPSRPVRAGEDEGAIRVELDDGSVILRRFTVDGKGDSIEVTNADGFRAPSPQRMLDSLYASVAFDPLAFTRMEPKEQLERLRALVPLDVDADALERANKTDFDTRQDKNRELKAERARLIQMPRHEDAPAQKVDETAIEQRINAAAEHNGDIERRRVARVNANEKVSTLNAEAADLRQRAADLIVQAEQREKDATELAERLAAAGDLPDPIDVTQAQTDLRDARAANAKADANRAHDVQGLLVASLEKETERLTASIDERRKQITGAIERAQMPVAGLSFGDGEVLFNGLPLEQASSAEQLRVSTAIGMASSPKLRVMLVRDGSLLDDDGERILAELAEQNDFQLWVEAVDASGKVGIVLEDGAVVAIDGEAPPEPEAIPSPRRRAKKATDEQAEALGMKSDDGGAAETPVGPVVGQGEDEAVVAEPSPEPEVVTEPWEDEADRIYDERRADADTAPMSLFD